jgi:hypothetical protein
MSSVGSTRSNDSYELEKSQLKEVHARDLKEVQSEYDEELTNAKKEYSERLVEIRKKAAEEVRKLKDESYDSLGRRYGEMERDGIRERKHLSDVHQSELKAMKKERDSREEYHHDRMNRATVASDEKTNTMLTDQKEEFRQISSQMRQDQEATRKYYEAELSNEKYRNNRSSERLVKESGNQTDRALSEQAKKYDEYVARNSEKTKYEMDEKEAEILDLKTNSDPNRISLEARRRIDEAHFRRQASEMAKVNESNRSTVDALKEQNGKIVQDLHVENSKRLHEANRELRSQHQAERSMIERNYRDLESRAEVGEANLRARQADQESRTYQKHAVEISKQEERHHESLKDQKAVLLDAKARERQDLEFQQRAERREFSTQLNETRREDEKKLLDQKAEHERELQSVKFENDKKLHEQERVAKRSLDERIRAYEFQLKHQESVNKEQKRLLTEHYEEELDKLNRNHALISQKKS